MAIYPILKANSFKESTSKPVLKSQYDGGYEIKRLKHTRQIKTFSLGYKALTVEEATSLENFIMSNQGVSFIFVHPITNQNHEVTYSGDSVDINFVTPLYRSASIVLKEV